MKDVEARRSNVPYVKVCVDFDFMEPDMQNFLCGSMKNIRMMNGTKEWSRLEARSKNAASKRLSGRILKDEW